MLLRTLLVSSLIIPSLALGEESQMAMDALAIERASFDQFLSSMPDRARSDGDYFADDPHANVLRVENCELRTQLMLNPPGQDPLIIGWGQMPIDATMEIEIYFVPWPAIADDPGPDLARLQISHPDGSVSLYSLASGWDNATLFSGTINAPLAPLEQLPLNVIPASELTFPFLEDRDRSSMRALTVAGMLGQYRDRYCTHFS